jgi:tetratricopeptide (TPR) repeat protein
MSVDRQALKAAGNAFFADKNYQAAQDHYSKAIEAHPLFRCFDDYSHTAFGFPVRRNELDAVEERERERKMKVLGEASDELRKEIAILFANKAAALGGLGMHMMALQSARCAVEAFPAYEKGNERVKEALGNLEHGGRRINGIEPATVKGKVKVSYEEEWFPSVQTIE